MKGKEFYFLEINTRIQVEHPITEAITGVDLVELQLKVAMGEPIPFEQKDIQFTGHAIELRINAEDPFEKFRPATGTITAWERPEQSDTREDYGYRVGDSIPPWYDSLISKVIVHGASRADALYKTFQLLKRYKVEGIPTTIPFHAWILSNPLFQQDGIDIGYVEREFSRDGAEAALKLLAVDPAHQEALDGQLYTEVVSSGQLPAGATTLSITHEPGGTFLAVPLDASGAPLAKSLWKRSTSRAAVIASSE